MPFGCWQHTPSDCCVCVWHPLTDEHHCIRDKRHFQTKPMPIEDSSCHNHSTWHFQARLLLLPDRQRSFAPSLLLFVMFDLIQKRSISFSPFLRDDVFRPRTSNKKFNQENRRTCEEEGEEEEWLFQIKPCVNRLWRLLLQYYYSLVERNLGTIECLQELFVSCTGRSFFSLPFDKDQQGVWPQNETLFRKGNMTPLTLSLF